MKIDAASSVLCSELYFCSKQFLRLNVIHQVNSFLRVMAAFTRFSFLFTNKSEILSWWCDDLPLPLPASSHGWARHPQLLVC